MNPVARALLAASIFAHSAQAGSIGRLFFTPEQRALLDYRQAHPADQEGGRTTTLVLNGIVQKNGGVRTTWVNGIVQSPHSEGRAAHAQQLAVPGKSQPVEIKVGQRLVLERADEK